MSCAYAKRKHSQLYKFAVATAKAKIALSEGKLDVVRKEIGPFQDVRYFIEYNRCLANAGETDASQKIPQIYECEKKAMAEVTAIDRRRGECSKDSDCVAVRDGCGYWIPINASDKNEYLADHEYRKKGGVVCRWKRPDRGPPPAFVCRNGQCKNKSNRYQDGISDVKPISK